MLSSKARYALRVMQNLARGDGKLIRASNIVLEEGLPAKFLDFVLADLKRARLIESVRGIYGGFRLTKAAHCVSVGQILDAVQAEIALLPCLLDTAPVCAECKRVDFCSLRGIVGSAQKQFLETLRSQSLADYHSDGRPV